MADDPVVPNPTYLGDIRFFFRDEDVQHMGDRGIPIGSYEDLKTNANRVLAVTAPPNAFMPPDTAGKWSQNRWQTFLNWINNQYPEGTTSPQTGGGAGTPTETPPADRMRKNVVDLGSDELELLKTAFTGLMDREPTDATSYVAIAGLHGQPGQHCMHHEDRFAPWHRNYLKVFEDQLRTIPECGNVTLPYWDLSTPLPDVLQQPPFDTYTVTAPVKGVPKDYKTTRFPVDQITSNLEETGALDQITKSLAQSKWGESGGSGYQLYSIQAHDNGHGSIGPTMGNQDYASYDPVFWFFHCNLDRLWLKWQGNAKALTPATFLGIVTPMHQIWFKPTLNVMAPWTTPTSDQTIAFGIGYDEPAEEALTLENKVGSIDALRSFAIKSSTPVSVRVKNINRINVPGTFAVHLLADGERIRKQFFFQPTDPGSCPGCVQNPLVNLTFDVDQEEILDRKLEVQVEVPGLADEDKRFPVSQLGEPTINARLLLEDD